MMILHFGQYYLTMKNVIAWQYTSKGIVPGIEGYVDCDVLYKNKERTEY